MKLLRKNIEKEYQGTVTLMPEEPEDMWHAYNLIAKGDRVRSTTIRKVQNETATGSSTSSRVRTTLTISVESIDFDTQACVLRLKGRNVEENQYVKMGAYHTLDLELNRKFDITKVEWDSIALERIDMACDVTQNADVAAVIMQDGLAHVCLITSSMTLVRSKIEVGIPRKRKGNVQQHEKGLAKFYDAVMQGIIRHVNFNVVKCVLIASPGFVKDQFFDYMIQQAIKLDNKLLLDNKSKFLLIHASSGFKHSLKEVLQDPAVVSKMSDTKAAGEVKVLENFYTMLQVEPSKAFYGKKHVMRAAEAQAIETLLISDNLFSFFYFQMGAYHTLDLELNRKFDITKVEWDSIALERIDMACDVTQNADVAAVIMQDGLAHVCLITSSMTLVRSKIEVGIPRKRKGNVQQHEKGLAKFYDAVMQGIIRHVNFNVVKCVLIASPGFVKDQFFDYMIQQAIKLDNKLLLDNKSKFLLIHASSGFKHSLKEVLQDPAVVSKMSDTKAAGEVKVLENFYTMLQVEPSKAFYGKKHVMRAAEAQAIETLLISDNLFRCQEISTRKEYVNLVDSVRDSGGEVKIFSSMHISGEQLSQLTGVAAILRFPMPELEEDSEGEDDDDNSDSD